MAEKQHVRKIRALMSLKYMRWLRLLLDVLAAWPHHLFEENKKAPKWRQYFFFTLFTCSHTLLTLYLVKHIKSIDFFEIGNCYVNVFLSGITYHRITMSLTKPFLQVTTDFFLEMHIFHYKDRNEHAAKVHERVHKICTLTTYYILIQMILGAALYNFTPMYNNYSSGMYSKDRPANKTFEHPAYYELPVNYSTDAGGYLFVWLLNWVLCYTVGLFICGYDLFLFIIVFHLWGHLKIIDYELRNFYQPKSCSPTSDETNIPWFTNEENQMITVNLKSLIDYHRLVKRFMKTIDAAFGPMMYYYHVFHLCGCCILLLECSRLDAPSLAKYGVLTVIIFEQLIQISVVVEILGTQSQTLKDAVYSVPWECMDKTNRMIVLFFLINTQEPLTLKAMGMTPVGVQTMFNIIKTSLSYFMLLRTFNSKN